MSQKNPTLPPLAKTSMRGVMKEAPKMWWGGYHWWWPGAVLMAVFMVACIAGMAFMMGHGRMPACMRGMRGFWPQRPGPHPADTSEQILDERLAGGEIDIQEYRRIRQTFAEINSPAGGQEAGSQQ